MPLPEKKAVIIDDETHVRTLISTILRSIGFDVVAQLDSHEGAADAVSRTNASLVMLDVNLPGVMGPEILSQILEQTDTCVIMLTAVQDAKVISSCVERGAAHYVLKSSGVAELKQIIAATWRAYWTEEE